MMKRRPSRGRYPPALDEEGPTYGDLNNLIASRLASMSREEAEESVLALRGYAKAIAYCAQMKWPDFLARPFAKGNGSQATPPEAAEPVK